MKYFIITFQVFVDKMEFQQQTIGYRTSKTNIDILKIKNTVTKKYRAMYIDAKSIGIRILNKLPVSQDEYYKAAKNFIDIT